MRTPKERVEYHVNKVAKALTDLGNVDATITVEQGDKIRFHLKTIQDSAIFKLTTDSTFKLENPDDR